MPRVLILAIATVLLLTTAACGSAPAASVFPPPTINLASPIQTASAPATALPTPPAATPFPSGSPAATPASTATTAAVPSASPAASVAATTSSPNETAFEATPPPTATSATAADPFSARSYSMNLPRGWVAFDLANPATQAALDAFVAANPDFAGPLQGFRAFPNAVTAVNALLGNFLIAVDLPRNGASLSDLRTSLTAQFAAVPGVTQPPVAEDITLPTGPAVHWLVSVSTNRTSGATVKVQESVYLVTNDDSAVIVSFVTLAGGVIPDENAIISSLRFK